MLGTSENAGSGCRALLTLFQYLSFVFCEKLSASHYLAAEPNKYLNENWWNSFSLNSV